jgi:hypothetical protein
VGYSLQALITLRPALRACDLGFREARVVHLSQDVVMIPITDALYDEVGDGGAVERFWKLSPGLEGLAKRLSAAGSAVYVEAEFFGGVGEQNSVGWAEGQRVLGPIHALDAINHALRFLGVRASSGQDEFDALGLGSRRETLEWLGDAG